jgi:hypothetical protein
MTAGRFGAPDVHPGMRTLFLVTLLATPALAAPEPTTTTLPVHDHRFETGARIGIIGGGEVTPHGAPRGYAETAVIVGAELNYLVHPYFTIGGYLGGMNATFTHESGDEMIGEGSLLIVSAGVTLKAHFELGPKTLARVGIFAGRNELRASGDVRGTDYDASGSGLSLAPTVELVYRVSPRYALSVQASFLSQPSGSMDFGDGDEDLAFKPMYYLSVGGELFH